MRLPSGTTDQYIYFYAVDGTDFTTPETGLSTFTVYRSRNGGAAAAMTTPTINETSSANMPGVYELLLDEDTTIDSGDDSQEMVLHIAHAGMAPVTRTIEIYRPKITVGETSITQTGDSYARLGAPAGASVSADVAALPTATQNADALLNRDMSAVTDSNARTPLNALRFLRNKYSISGVTLTVTKEDDATSAWTSVLTTSAGADPVVGSDPV